MGLFRKIGNFLGFGRDEEHRFGGGEEEEERVVEEIQDFPRKGFSVKAKVAVERPHLGPLFVPCQNGQGGVQGFEWYQEKLRIDEDGDVADEFLCEPLPVPSEINDNKAPVQLKVNDKTRPARVITNQTKVLNGNVLHCVECNGRLEWF